MRTASHHHGSDQRLRCTFAAGVCRRCGRVNHTGAPDANVVAHCRYNPSPGLGDLIARWLAAVGVTKSRYRRLKVRWGLADACNCAERQEQLNRLGRWIAGRRRRQ